MGKKELIIYEDHRNIKDVLATNKNYYRFINLKHLHRLAKLFSAVCLRNKEKAYAKYLYWLLFILNPKYILVCNWLSPKQKIFYLFSKQTHTKLIVVQHGAYVGGLVRNDHRYLKCDKFLVWGPYFKKLFNDYNKNREDDIVIFGNPLYNKYDRSKFRYPETQTRILVAFSFIKTEDLDLYWKMIDQLFSVKSNISVKYHVFQKEKINYTKLPEVKGSFENIVNDFDIVIADHSTVFLDAIFFKKPVIYISNNTTENLYEKYLGNSFHTIRSGSFNLDELINIEKQEALFSYMVTMGNNDLDIFK